MNDALPGRFAAFGLFKKSFLTTKHTKKAESA